MSPNDDDFDGECPGFLELIDSDRELALTRLYHFVHRLVSISPPRNYLWYDKSDREDFTQLLLCKLMNDNCRALRSYRPMGRPFRVWLRVQLQHLIIDWKRKRDLRPEDPSAPPDHPEPDQAPAPDEQAATGQILELLARCREQLPPPCDAIIEMRADGASFKTIAVAINLRHDQNQKAWERWKSCTEKLVSLALRAGVPLAIIPEKMRPPLPGGERHER